MRAEMTMKGTIQVREMNVLVQRSSRSVQMATQRTRLTAVKPNQEVRTHVKVRNVGDASLRAARLLVYVYQLEPSRDGTREIPRIRGNEQKFVLDLAPGARTTTLYEWDWRRFGPGRFMMRAQLAYRWLAAGNQIDSRNSAPFEVR